MSIVGRNVNPNLQLGFAGGSYPTSYDPTFSFRKLINGFTSANTINAKKAINDVKNSVGSRHICVCGNSTKAGWGSNGSAFGVPGTLAGASLRSLGQVKKWADQLATQYSIQVSSNNFWGDAGWNSVTSLTGYDPRLAASATATLSSTVLGPGGRSLTTTNATDTWAFTPGTQFDRLVLFYAGIGATFNVTGDVSGLVGTSTAGSGNAIQQTTFSFGALNNTVTFQGTSASGFRIYGGYTFKSTDPATLYVHNMGWGNSTSANWSSTTVGSAPRDAINSLNPSLILFSEGINDPNTGVALATHHTNMQTFFNNIKTGSQDAIWYEDHYTASLDVDGAAGHANLSVIQATLDDNRASAAALGIPYIDSPYYFQSYARQKNVLSEMYDVSHANGNGHIDQATNILMPATLAWMAA